jgi:hypothetical protein
MKTLRLVFVVAGLATAASLPEHGRRWWRHVEFLASDKLEGREAGSPGHRQAAEYVAAQFERAGLKPAGTSGAFQPVTFESRVIDESASSLVLIRNRERTPMVLGEHAILSLRIDPPERVTAPLVFVGYGIYAPEEAYDDLAGLDLTGKIAVYFAAAPAQLKGAVASHYQATAERWRGLSKAGAVGAVALNVSVEPGSWLRSTQARLIPAMSLLNSGTRGKLAVAWNSAYAGLLLTDAAELTAKATRGEPLPHFATGVSLEARVAVRRQEVVSDNVLGLLEGSDPELRKERIVLTAHLDHLGRSTPVNGDGIYNGAMDNASGVASLIEIASALKARPLRRSVLFAAVTGEEKGLLGSQYLATREGNAVAAVNFDMFLPLFSFTSVMALGLEESEMGDHLRQVAEPLGLEVQSDPEPKRNRFTRSDQYSFIRRGVPALAFKFGYRPGSPEEVIAKKWNASVYHRPSDDLAQPVDIGAAGAFNDLMARLVESIANAGERPRWKPDSFFRRFAE